MTSFNIFRSRVPKTNAMRSLASWKVPERISGTNARRLGLRRISDSARARALAFQRSEALARDAYLCTFTLLCQNDFKPTIGERIRKCTPGRRVAPHAAELGTISHQFASPDTKGAFTHYTTSVNGTRTRITHCSLLGPPTLSMDSSSRQMYF